MLAFVTGATGFLGSHVARVLAEQGTQLRLLVRPTSDLRNLDDLKNADRVVGARSGVDVVIVNPTTPVGERDIKPTPTGRIVLDFLKRKFPAYVETGLNLVDATECARGHIQALEKGRSGERYILGGENLTLKQILDRLAAITGLKSPTLKLPYAFAF